MLNSLINSVKSRCMLKCIESDSDCVVQVQEPTTLGIVLMNQEFKKEKLLFSLCK